MLSFSAGKQYGNFKSMNIKKPSMSDGNAIKAIGCGLLWILRRHFVVVCCIWLWPQHKVAVKMGAGQ